MEYINLRQRQWDKETWNTAKLPGITIDLTITYNQNSTIVFQIYTAWNMSKCGVFSGPHFPIFKLNTKIHPVNLRIQSKYGKIQTRKNSAFGQFLRSEGEIPVCSPLSTSKCLTHSLILCNRIHCIIRTETCKPHLM